MSTSVGVRGTEVPRFVRVVVILALAATSTVMTPFTGPAAAAGTAVSLSVSTPTATSAGRAFAVTVTARDAAGLVATSYRGRVVVTPLDPRSPVLPAYTFTAADGGRHTFTGAKLFTAGSRAVAAVDTQRSTVKGRSAAIAVAPGPLSRLAVTAPTHTTAGTDIAVTVTAKDPWFNIVPAYRGTVQLTSTDATAVLPPLSTFTATDRGTRVFPVQLRRASAVLPVTVTATDLVRTTITGRTGPVTVSPGPMNFLEGSSPSRAAVGVPFVSNVTAYDMWGNVATGSRGTVHLISNAPGQAKLAPPHTWVAADQGTFTFEPLVFRTSGTWTISIVAGAQRFPLPEIEVDPSPATTG